MTDPNHAKNRTHSGVCHSDLGVMTNSWAALPYPTQPGQVSYLTIPFPFHLNLYLFESREI